VIDLSIRGGTVVTLDPARRVVRADVHVDQGRVLAVGGPPQRARASLDADGMLVIPGLVDLHDHLRDLAPGLRVGEGLKIDAYLRAHWRLQQHLGTDEYRVGAMMGASRLLKSGVTSVVDHIYPFHRPGLLEAAVMGYQASGIRWFVARGIMTRPYRPITERQGDAFHAMLEALDTVVPKESLFVAPVSFRQAPPGVFVRARSFADRHGLRLYTHVAESKVEVEQIRRNHGTPPVELLHRLGFAGEDTVLVHCVYLSAGEVGRLQRSRTHVVHCPSNHMKLAKGVTPVPRLLAKGINVGLGIDTMDDMFTEMRQEVLLQGLASSNPAALAPQTALEMATLGGAAALGMSDELGSIEAGKRADLVCVDLAGHQPVIDPVWSLVHRAHGHDVAHVVVDGRVVVKHGRLTLLDESALTDEVAAVSAAYLKRAGVAETQPAFP
jgi:cytosine/adenosine deaminase-related metal-dependent hydrolase